MHNVRLYSGENFESDINYSLSNRESGKNDMGHFL